MGLEEAEEMECHTQEMLEAEAEEPLMAPAALGEQVVVGVGALAWDFQEGHLRIMVESAAAAAAALEDSIQEVLEVLEAQIAAAAAAETMQEDLGELEESAAFMAAVGVAALEALGVMAALEESAAVAAAAQAPLVLQEVEEMVDLEPVGEAEEILCPMEGMEAQGVLEEAVDAPALMEVALIQTMEAMEALAPEGEVAADKGALAAPEVLVAAVDTPI